ncbi:DUF1653 domain-containing protein [Lachnospiraceae bacterium LCP25S3_G4]
MERRLPKQGDYYRHFKGQHYQVLTLATHSETSEEMVVYEALYGEHKVFVRPLELFISKVDTEKYPDMMQEYRFELEEEGSNEAASVLMQFLESSTYEEKVMILEQEKVNMNEELLSAIADSLDFAEREQSLEERYESILKYLKTLIKYESGRLR